jgi:hypothetical protein
MPTEKALPRSQVFHLPAWVYVKIVRSPWGHTTALPEGSYLTPGVFKGLIPLEPWRFAKERR